MGCGLVVHCIVGCSVGCGLCCGLNSIIVTYSLLLVSDSLPHFSCFLGQFNDRNAWILLFDAFSLVIQPQHIGCHRPLGLVRVTVLLSTLLTWLPLLL